MVAFRRRTGDQYRALVDAVGGDWMHWTGTFTWADRPETAIRLARDHAAMNEAGFPIRRVGAAETHAQDPALLPPADAVVYLEEDGGWIDAPAMVATLLAAARANGAIVHENSPVKRIDKHTDGFAIQAGSHEIRADVVVNAAGSWASHVGALAGAPIPMDLRPGLLVTSQPLKTPLRRVVNSTELNIRPDPLGGVAIHWRGEDTYTAHAYNAVSAAQTLAAAAAIIPEIQGTRPAGSSVGIRPIPPTGPIVGWHPSLAGLYVAVSHGGIGWAPEWAAAAVSAIIDGSTAIALSPFSPDRFFRSAS
jgi:glycine/D-amino acid oxidase-like deaminating enzyme